MMSLLILNVTDNRVQLSMAVRKRPTAFLPTKPSSHPFVSVNKYPVNRRAIPTKLYEMCFRNGREALGLDSNTDEGRNKLDQLREGIVSELIDRTLIAQVGVVLLVASELCDGAALGDELNKGLSVSNDEIKTYYRAHQREPAFQEQERVTAAHRLIAARPNLITQQLQQDKNLSGEELASVVREEIARRRRRAEQLRRQAAAGTDFAALAKESSDDPGSRAQGGDLGTFTRDSHPRAFDDAAFSLKPGRISSVVQTEYGFHIIKVTAHEPAGAQTLAEATPEIRRLLLDRREAEKLSQWLKETRRKASVHINEPFRLGSLASEFPN